MTSEPTATFPLNLIQNSVKMTYENPIGLKANLLHSYQTGLLNTNFYDICPKQDKLFKQMLYSLTFFDVVINERKNYETIGWNVAYEFDVSDFIQSAKQLNMFLCDGKPTPFKTLHYIISECFYGGRIIEEYDKRLLKTILLDTFNGKILENPTHKINSCKLPLRFEHRFILKFIEDNIPDESNCKVYGLHENSDFLFKLKNSNDLLNSMTIARGIETTNNLGKSDFLLKLTEIIDKLPGPIDVDDTNFGFTYDKSSNSVAASEMKMFNNLLKVIRKTCTELEQAIQGSFSFSPCLPFNII